MIFKTFKQSLEDVYIAGRKINEINNQKLDVTNITAYATALKELNAKQTELVLSTKGLTVTQKQAVLSEVELLGATGKLTTAELEAILVTKKRNKDQAEALLINTGLITSETTEATATNVVTAAKLKELVATGKLTQAEANLIAAKAGVTLASQKESTSLLAGIGAKIKGAGTALKGLGTGILTIAQAHPVIAAITAALALCGVTALVNKVKQENSARAIKKAYTEAKNAIEEINNTYSTNTSQTKAIAKEYAELAQGVDLLTNSNETLSTEKYERFLELSNQLSKLYPSLTKNFDNNSVAILDLSGDVDTIVGSLDNLIERQRILANQEIMKQMPGLFAGYSDNTSKYKKQVEDAEETKKKIKKVYEEINKYELPVWFDGLSRPKDEEGNDAVALTGDAYEYLLHELGITVKRQAVNDSAGRYAGYKLVLEDGSDIDFSYVKDMYVTAFEKASDDVKYAEQQFEAELSSINQYLNTWLQTESSYNQIKDNGLQDAVKNALFNFDWSSLPEDIDKNDWEAVSEHLRRNILFAIKNVQDNNEIATALSEIFSNTELTPDEKVNYLQQIQDFFGEDNIITISLKMQIDDAENLQKQYQHAIDFAKDKFDGYNPTTFFKEHSINTQEEIDNWQEIAQVARDAAEAEKEYVQSSTLNNKNHFSLSLSQTVDQLNTQLKPAMDSLKSAWQDIFTDDEFALNSINILSTCDSIKSKLDEMSKLGLKVEYSSYEDFVRVLRDSKSTTNDVKEAFNSLTTSITQAALSGAEDFETMKAALEDLGVVNSEMVAFDALISNTEALKEADLDLASATYNDIKKFADERVATENLEQAINMLTQQKMLSALEDMDTSTEVSNMIALAKQAGMASEVIANLTELEKIYQKIASGTITNDYMSSGYADRAEELKQLIMDEITKVDYTPEVDFSHIEKATKKAEIDFSDLLDKELAVLDKKMEAGYINFNDYIQARLALIEDYYGQGKIKSDEYYSYLENHYKQELSYRDKVIKAVTRRIDKEIKSLEKEKDAIKENYQIQIDALENQKTLLEDVNKERQRQIDLQKALYELERAKNQRTKLVYSEGGGIHYVADDTAIRDAENEAENARHEIQISEIEKSITLLEKSRDAETDAIDDMIDKLQEYKEAWNDITSAYEESQEDLLAAQFFGQEWEEDIINCRTDVLNKFKDDYADIQQSIVDMAWESANEQIRAAKEAAKGADGVMGGAHKIGETTEDEPSYYYIPKKYHTGLQQGTVNAHSFDDDFKLVQKVGLGKNEVPAILKEGEAVATSAQISNIADGLRTADSSHSVQAERPYFMDEQERLEQCAALLGRSIDDMVSPISLLPHNIREMANMSSLNHVGTVNNIKQNQPNINVGGIHITCPGITSQEVARQVGTELNNMFNGFHLEAMQQSMMR